LHQLFCWVSENAAGLTAVFTFLYLIATILIFNEARKSADAAKGSATAAQSSSDTASTTASLMRQQVQDQVTRSEAVFRASVEVALATTTAWRGKAGDLVNMNSLKSLPPTDNLILPYTVVEAAAAIDFGMAMKLSAALGQMGLARAAFESTRSVDNRDGKNSGHFARAGEEAATHLDAATELLQEVALFLGKYKP